MLLSSLPQSTIYRYLIIQSRFTTDTITKFNQRIKITIYWWKTRRRFIANKTKKETKPARESSRYWTKLSTENFSQLSIYKKSSNNSKREKKTFDITEKWENARAESIWVKWTNVARSRLRMSLCNKYQTPHEGERHSHRGDKQKKLGYLVLFWYHQTLGVFHTMKIIHNVIRSHLPRSFLFIFCCHSSPLIFTDYLLCFLCSLLFLFLFFWAHTKCEYDLRYLMLIKTKLLLFLSLLTFRIFSVRTAWTSSLRQTSPPSSVDIIH